MAPGRSVLLEVIPKAYEEWGEVVDVVYGADPRLRWPACAHPVVSRKG